MSTSPVTPLYKQIYIKYQLSPASHMTHLDNLDGILRAGELRAYNLMRGLSYRNLANDDVQAGRAAKIVPCTGRWLHDYVPLYFGGRTPMVAVNQDQNENLIFIRFSLNILEYGGVVITDGNARFSVTQFRVFTQLSDLGFLDPRAINGVKYGGDPELKRKKQAEILIPDRLPLTHVIDFMCFSVEARAKVFKTLDQQSKKFRVCVSPGNWYFRTQQAKGPLS